MKRRPFVVCVASLVAATRVPLSAAERTVRVGLLAAGSPQATPFHDAFRQGMRELGWVEGRNLRIEYRYADGRSDRLPELAAELVRARVDVFVAAATQSSLAAKAATRTIPVVIVAVGDPVGVGLVSNLAHPGGNVTGFSYSVGLETFAKSLELFRPLVPGVRRFGVLINPANPAQSLAARDLESAAEPMGIDLHVLGMRTPGEFDQGFTAMRKAGAGAVVVVTDSLFITHRARIAELATTHRLPSLHGAREGVEAGGLLSYGPNIADQFRRAATYVDKILRGAKPGDLPVEQPVKFELVVNLRTARAIGIDVPQSLLLRADEVIR